MRLRPSGAMMRSLVIAQSLGEYAGGSGGLFSELGASVQAGANWLQLSLREDRNLWITGVVCLGLVLWFFRRR